MPWDGEGIDDGGLYEEEGLFDDAEEDLPPPRCDTWKVFQFGPKGPAWIHTEREIPITEEVLLSMFGPGTYRVIGHLKGREVYSTLVRIGVPQQTAAPAALAPVQPDNSQLGQLVASMQILERLRPPAPQPVDPLVLAERLARLMRLGDSARPAPLPPADPPQEATPRGLDWPEAVLHLADLVAEKFPSVTGVRLQPAQVIEFLREPGVLEEVMSAAVQDPDIAGRILEYFRNTQEPPTM
ncbi:MAG: hypothetical protein E6R03_08370 [Hyphomicrobiaceae bacterium]|nr:MAG: hypothetical protein E6R03_08370 [Hyphomicrobiaceae bacterium]